MTKYIDRDKVLVELECGIRAGNYEEGYEGYMHINDMDDCVDTVKYFDTADVVEREEYDLLRRQLTDSWNRIDELDKLNGNMRKKILDFIDDNRPTNVQTDWERGCAYICEEIEKLLM